MDNRLKDAAFKARILIWLIRGAINTWRTEVAPVDLDTTYCCDGRECCCAASTHRDIWSQNNG
jgi:hypothetical protein